MRQFGNKFFWLFSILSIVACQLSGRENIELDKYYQLTANLPQLLVDIPGEPDPIRNFKAGDLVIPLSKTTSEIHGKAGYLPVLSDKYHDVGWINISLLQKTEKSVYFPDDRVIENNAHPIFFGRNLNNDSDSTFGKVYRFLALFPNLTMQVKISLQGKILLKKAFDNFKGLKFVDVEFDMTQFAPGENTLEIKGYGADQRELYSRPFYLRRDLADGKIIKNNESRQFQYSSSNDKIEIEKFFGYSMDVEDYEHFKPDFNQYLIEGPEGYSFLVGLEADPQKIRRRELPLFFRVIKNGKECARFLLNQWELTPQGSDFSFIKNFENFFVIRCLPGFEAAERAVFFDKARNKMFDAWELLKSSGIEKFHWYLEVSISDKLVLKELKSRYNDLDKPTETYTFDLHTLKLLDRKAN